MPDVLTLLGDCVESMRGLPDASVDAVVTDPPYGINFMGKAWDGAAIEEAVKDRPASAMPPRLTGDLLMRWLIRLVTPPNGTVLDPFLGSGSTGCAAVLEGVSFVGCEREPDYMAIAEARIGFWREHGVDGLRIVRERDAAERDRKAIADAGQLDIFSSENAA